MAGAIGGPKVDPGGPGLPPIGVSTDPVSSYSWTRILDAIELGYRHIHTFISDKVEHYKALKEAIKEALKRKLVNSRDDIYITCRIEHKSGNNTIVHDLKKFLEEAEIQHVDLLIIHWPDSNIPNPDIKSAWKAMEECQNLGLAKSIGTMDSSIAVLKYILEFSEIPPFTNQVGMDVFLNDNELVGFCTSNRIAMMVRCTMDKKHRFVEMIEQGAFLLLESYSSKEDLQQLLQMIPQS